MHVAAPPLYLCTSSPLHAPRILIEISHPGTHRIDMVVAFVDDSAHHTVVGAHTVYTHMVCHHSPPFCQVLLGPLTSCVLRLFHDSSPKRRLDFSMNSNEDTCKTSKVDDREIHIAKTAQVECPTGNPPA
jgi:hypothetical protein